MIPRSLCNLRWMFSAIVAMLLWLSPVVTVRVQAQSDQETITVALEEVDDSGVTGTAMLTANGEQTDVAIRLTGATGDHPNHIHENFCAEVNPVPMFPLTHINVGETDPDGFTESTVDVSLDELLAGEYSILVHLSDEQMDEYLVCGNIGTPQESAAAANIPSIVASPTASTATVRSETDRGAVGPGKGTTIGAVDEMPTTGVGPGSRSDVRLLALIASLTVLAAGVAISTARRTRLG